MAPTLLLAFLARDEEFNIRRNLPRYGAVADFVCAGVDERTTDGSARAISEALPDIPRRVFYLRWSRRGGFGAARTLVFKEAWRVFGGAATHVLALDPDWVPAVETLDKARLDVHHAAFAVYVTDRNGLTARHLDWLVPFSPNLYFEHRLHEQLVRGDGAAKLLRWNFAEASIQRTWHANHSQSYGRYAGDLEVLGEALADDPTDAHALYYTGVTHLAALEALLGLGEHAVTDVSQRHVDAAISHLEDALEADLPDEQKWAARRWLAHAHHHLTKNYAKARRYYEQCAALDATRPDCPAFRASLDRRQGLYDEAFAGAFRALAAATDTAHPRALDSVYIRRCVLPLEAALALAAQIPGLGPALRDFGAALLERAACDDAARGYVTASPTDVAAARRALGARRACAPAAELDGFPGVGTMSAWGLVICNELY
jgi:tetratricopeptide (TPR) repeat protein